MKISKSIEFRNFKKIKLKKKILDILDDLKKEQNQILQSFGKAYKNSYSQNFVRKINKFKNINLIGIGGSILGSKAIYSFLKQKINKNFNFIDNLGHFNSSKKKEILNLLVSKSGNTMETIANLNFYIHERQKNIIITEKKKNFLNILARKLKAEVISHNNFIGGRYSVLSEVGMLPADLMGLNHLKFRQFNNLVKNKKFINTLISNVSNILDLSKKKTNSIILNYDPKSSDLFYWYQQLVAESLGKKGKGFLPVISNLPKDNHSLMQLYLSGRQNNFFTFFFVNEKSFKKINNKKLIGSNSFLMNKSINDIKTAQFYATRRIFEKKKIPFRSFLIKKRDEKTLGELFIFFMLETILLGRALNVNPYDQPSVELIKTETRKFF